MEKINYLYETGIVYPDVLGSSDQKCNEFFSRNESEAFDAYTKGRNYLIRSRELPPLSV